MPTTPTARKAVKTITIAGTGINNTTVLSATTCTGESVEIDKIAAFGDTGYTSVPRNVKSYSDLKVTVLDEGGALASAFPAVGTVVAVTLTLAFNSGAPSETDTTRAIARNCAIVSAEPGGEVSVDGDRKATLVITLTPHAPAAASED